MPRSTENKLLHIPCTTGVNQSASPRLSPTGTFDTVTNCRISGNGILEARPGIIGLPGATSTDLSSQAAPQGVFHMIQGNGSTYPSPLPCYACTVGDALMVGQSYGDAFCYSPSTSLWQFQGRFSTALPVRKRYGLAIDDTSSGNGFGTSPPDIAANSLGQIAVCCLTTAGDLHFYIEDKAGVRLYYRQESQSYTRARVLAFADNFLLVVQSGTSLLFQVFSIIGGQPSLNFSGILGIALANTSTSWDIYAVGMTTADWILAAHSAATTISLGRFANSGTQLVGVSFTVPSATTEAISLYVDTVNAKLWLGMYDSNNDVSYAVFDVSAGSINSTPVVTRKVLKTGVNTNLGPPLFGRYVTVNNSIPSGQNVFYVFKQFSTSGLSDHTAAAWVGIASGNSVSRSVPQAIWHYLPVSKPDDYNRFWCLHQTNVANQTTTKLLLLRVPAFNTSPTIELSSPNQLYLSGYSDATFFSSWVFANSRGYFAALSVLQTFAGPKATFRVDVYEHTLAESEPHRASKVTEITTTIAGQPVEFYGQSVPIIQNTITLAKDTGAFDVGASEIGFPNSPVIFAANPSTTGGALEPGTRQWRVVFEWIDMYGRRHQSAPSPPISATTTGTTSSVQLSISTLNVTQKQSANTNIYVYLKIYRTVAGGIEFHELPDTLTAIDIAGGTGLISPTDRTSDAVISQNGFIYTDGNVLQNDLAPSCRFLAASEDRVWFGGLWDSTIIQASKVIVPGEPIQCTDDPSHQVVLPAPVTGLAYTDGNIVVFCDSSIYLVPSTGGPNDQGAGSFSAPTQLTRSVGCIDYRSILETNIGVFFQSKLGIYLLPRGFGPVQYVGVAVQDLMAQVGDVSPIVLGAASQISKGNHLAQFLISQANTGGEAFAQTILSYDIDGGTWFTDSLHWFTREICSVGNAFPFGGLAYVLNDLTSTNFSQPVLYESATVSTDSDANGSVATNTQTLRSNWIHPFGLGGWGKVKRILVAVECLAPASRTTLQVTVETDGQQPAVSSETATFSLQPMANNPVQYREVIPTLQACTAFRVTLATTNVKFISATAELEDSQGARLLSSAEKQ